MYKFDDWILVCSNTIKAMSTCMKSVGFVGTRVDCAATLSSTKSAFIDECDKLG